jgi:[CysO sulfur-carrier protein]-S-L-cysteine hydrolase
MLQHAQQAPCEECCGLLAGRDGLIARVVPATNVAREATKNYEIAPEELFRVMREIRSAGLELLGVYHSHPHGTNEPSLRDVERAYYPDLAYFILSPRANVAAARAFSIQDGRVSELKIEIVSEGFSDASARVT